MDRTLSEARSSAFRLEVRNAYCMPHESLPFQRFLEGVDPGREWIQPWLNTVQNAANRGVRIERVRVIDEPPNDYQRFLLAAALHNANAGEDIRYLTRSAAGKIGLPSGDYWLLDSSKLYLCHYGDDGQFLRYEASDNPELIAASAMHRDLAWAHATPLTKVTAN